MMTKICSMPLLGLALVVSGLSSAPSVPAAESTEQPGHEAELLANTRQLIFEGLRSGEGYFSADGIKMVFRMLPLDLCLISL